MPRTRAGQRDKKGAPNGATPRPVFDVGAHRLAERFDVAIVDPNGAPTAMVVTLASRYAKEYRTRKMALDRAFRASPAGQTEVTAEQYSDIEMLHMVVAQTVAWTGFAVDGVPLECTTDTARDLYTSPGLGWLYEQVAEESFRRERFFIRPSNAS